MQCHYKKECTDTRVTAPRQLQGQCRAMNFKGQEHTADPRFQENARKGPKFHKICQAYI